MQNNESVTISVRKQKRAIHGPSVVLHEHLVPVYATHQSFFTLHTFGVTKLGSFSKRSQRSQTLETPAGVLTTLPAALATFPDCLETILPNWNEKWPVCCTWKWFLTHFQCADYFLQPNKNGHASLPVTFLLWRWKYMKKSLIIKLKMMKSDIYMDKLSSKFKYLNWANQDKQDVTSGYQISLANQELQCGKLVKKPSLTYFTVIFFISVW